MRVVAASTTLSMVILRRPSRLLDVTSDARLSGEPGGPEPSVAQHIFHYNIIVNRHRQTKTSIHRHHHNTARIK